MNSNLVQKLRQEFIELDFRRCSLHCHGDNASKELKNNSVFRLLSALVGCRWLHACSFNTLQSGHSHEDIDEAFSALAGQHSFALKFLAQLMTALSCLRIIFEFHGFLQILRQRRCQRQPRLVHDQSQNQLQKRTQITKKCAEIAGTRPTEPVRRVFRDKDRAWSFGLFVKNIPVWGSWMKTRSWSLFF